MSKENELDSWCKNPDIVRHLIKKFPGLSIHVGDLGIIVDETIRMAQPSKVTEKKWPSQCDDPNCPCRYESKGMVEKECKKHKHHCIECPGTCEEDCNCDCHDAPKEGSILPQPPGFNPEINDPMSQKDLKNLYGVKGFSPLHIIQNATASFSLVTDMTKPNVVFATLYTREDAERVLGLLNGDKEGSSADDEDFFEFIKHHCPQIGSDVDYSRCAKDLAEHVKRMGYAKLSANAGLVELDDIIKDAINDLDKNSWNATDDVENNIKVCSLNNALSWLSKCSRLGTLPSPVPSDGIYITQEQFNKVLDGYHDGNPEQWFARLDKAWELLLKGQK